MSKTLHHKYGRLEALTLSEIDTSRVDMIVVRTRYPATGITTITKLTSADIMIPPGHGYATSRQQFIELIESICATPDHTDRSENIVRWRDNDHMWHIHSGPVERHLKIGDKVQVASGYTGHVIRIVDEPFAIGTRPAGLSAEIAFPHWNEIIPLTNIHYVDTPDVPVIP